GNLCQADVGCGHAQARATEQALAVLDRFPALLDRREIPPLAPSAHDPQATAGRIEGKTAPDGEMLDRFVLAELRLAEDAGGIQCWSSPSPSWSLSSLHVYSIDRNSGRFSKAQ